MKKRSVTSLSTKQIQRQWYLLDARGQVLGRLATQIAKLLMGKGKPEWVPYLDCGDYVVVINAKDIRVTGRKEEQKIYTRYSGYPGGLRKETLGSLKKRRPEEVIRHAVEGMLPKNKLRARWIRKLYIYPGSEHPHEAQLGRKHADGTDQNAD